jgi:hypothetical protein
MQSNTGDATYDGAGNPTNASAFLRSTASRNTANDPRGLNAFNRFDVNSDGLVTRTDAAIIDHFYSKSFTNMGDQIAATINVNGTLAPGVQKPISLVDVQQIDGAPAIGAADLHDWLNHNPNLVLDGDANFDGGVNVLDLNMLLPNFNQSGTHWATGDFNGDGATNVLDLNLLLPNFNTALPSDTAALVTWAQSHVSPGELSYIQSWAADTVPEPGTFGVVGIAAAGLLVRRSRVNG